MITALQTLEYLEDQMGRFTEFTLLSLVENPYYKNWNIFGYQTGNENDPYGTEQLLLTTISNYYSQVNVQGDYLKVLEQIKTIVDTSYYKYQKLYDSLNFEYDPIVNYDRTDTETTLLNRSNVDTTTDDDRQMRHVIQMVILIIQLRKQQNRVPVTILKSRLKIQVMFQQ